MKLLLGPVDLFFIDEALLLAIARRRALLMVGASLLHVDPFALGGLPPLLLVVLLFLLLDENLAVGLGGLLGPPFVIVLIFSLILGGSPILWLVPIPLLGVPLIVRRFLAQAALVIILGFLFSPLAVILVVLIVRVLFLAVGFVVVLILVIRIRLVSFIIVVLFRTTLVLLLVLPPMARLILAIGSTSLIR